jgi:hypothetical protein
MPRGTTLLGAVENSAPTLTELALPDLLGDLFVAVLPAAPG